MWPRETEPFVLLEIIPLFCGHFCPSRHVGCFGALEHKFTICPFLTPKWPTQKYYKMGGGGNSKGQMVPFSRMYCGGLMGAPTGDRRVSEGLEGGLIFFFSGPNFPPSKFPPSTLPFFVVLVNFPPKKRLCLSSGKLFEKGLSALAMRVVLQKNS